MIAVRMSGDNIIKRIVSAGINIVGYPVRIFIFSRIYKHCLCIRQFDENAVALSDINKMHLHLITVKVIYIVVFLGNALRFAV